MEGLRRRITEAHEHNPLEGGGRFEKAVHSLIAIRAARSIGNPYTPVLIAGNAIDFRFSFAASLSELR